MAEDAVVLLDYIGWKEERGVHVVGVSMGMLLLGVSILWYTHRSRARWYDCARFAVLTAHDQHSLFRIVVKSTELATVIPHRIASLSLIVTTAGGRPWNNFPPVGPTKMRWSHDTEKKLAQRHGYPDKVLEFSEPSCEMNLTTR